MLLTVQLAEVALVLVLEVTATAGINGWLVTDGCPMLRASIDGWKYISGLNNL